MSGPTGLKLFQQHFAPFADQYVLIGGTATFLAMEHAGLDFRATKDLDIVLIAEALTSEFARVFWDFVLAGGYTQQEKSGGGRQCYRFSKPIDRNYPAMLELFSRVPDGLNYEPPGVLTPLPFEDEVASLSAILLDDAYYQLLMAGTVREEGLSWLNEQMLIPFKAKAWLDLRARQLDGVERAYVSAS
jgi:hypothetical protein